MGGPDAEHEVSLMSGGEVAQALRDTGRYEVTELVLERRGATADEIAAVCGRAQSGATDEAATCTGKRVSARRGRTERKRLPSGARLSLPCRSDPPDESGGSYESECRPGGPYGAEKPAVVFPVLHGQWGEGGPLQDILETLGHPYVGSDPRAAAVAMDKPATKQIVRAQGVLTPPGCLLDPGAPCPLAPPLVLKPIDDGSSLDLRICHSPQEVAAARAVLHQRRGPIMAERLVIGREVTAGIVCGEPLPLIEIIPPPDAGFYDYQAKYFRDDTRYVLDPDLPAGAAQTCTEAALEAFNLLGCRDVARADFIVNDFGAWFLEINTMPGFTTHSLLPMAAARRGEDMPTLCGRLVEAALARAPVPVGAAHHG